MTRRCSALALLAALIWTTVSPWLGVVPAPAEQATVVARAELPGAAGEWLPSPAAADQLARLAELSPGAPGEALRAGRLGAPGAAERCGAAAVPPAPRIHRRPHALRGSGDPDEPS